jgi:hypothetical protein
MTGIALAIFIVCIAYVMVWSIKNDHTRSIGDQTGLIKMRDPDRAKRKFAGRAGDRQSATTQRDSGP